MIVTVLTFLLQARKSQKASKSQSCAEVLEVKNVCPFKQHGSMQGSYMTDHLQPRRPRVENVVHTWTSECSTEYVMHVKDDLSFHALAEKPALQLHACIHCLLVIQNVKIAACQRRRHSACSGIISSGDATAATANASMPFWCQVSPAHQQVLAKGTCSLPCVHKDFQILALSKVAGQCSKNLDQLFLH